jgi:hypothetical protein
MGVRHVVLVSLKDDATDEQKKAAVEGLMTLSGLVPGMRSYSAGLDLGVAGTHDVAIVGDFDDIESLQAYLAHETHRSVAGAVLAPIMEGSSRVQYAIEP